MGTHVERLALGLGLPVPKATVLLALLYLSMGSRFPLCSCSATTCEFPAVFNFGDSNSDTGGLSAVYGQVQLPNGETFFHRPSGRSCDGRLLIDFIAEDLRLPYLSAYLNSLGSNFSHGANFATAGSTIRPQNTTHSQSGYSPISLDVQLVEYSNFVTSSQIIRSQGGIFAALMPEEEHFSQALYTFDIGQNDLTAGLRLNMTVEQIKGYIPDVISQLSDAIKKVYALGGRSFWIHNTGPLGCLIYVMDRFLVSAAQEDEHGCIRSINELAQYFNGKLKQAVDVLRRDLPLASITHVDLYSVKYNLIAQARKHGFQLPFVACCGHGGKYNYNNSRRCGSKITVKGKEITIAKSCKNPAVRINWDGIHFTEAANKWMFKQIVYGSYSEPPNPLEMACRRMDP